MGCSEELGGWSRAPAFFLHAALFLTEDDLAKHRCGVGLHAGEDVLVDGQATGVAKGPKRDRSGWNRFSW